MQNDWLNALCEGWRTTATWRPDLQDLFEAVGAAAQAGGSCVALFVDELQYVQEDELAALITALHRTAQRRLPVTMVGAGLPQVRGHMGKAKTYAERLFEFVRNRIAVNRRRQAGDYQARPRRRRRDRGPRP